MFGNSVEKFGNHGENPFGYIESEKFKGAVHRLEVLKQLSSQDKMLILATSLNLKPATVFDLETSREGKQELITILSDLGLFFFEDNDVKEIVEAFYPEYKSQQGEEFVQFVVGNTPETISEAMNTPLFGEDDKAFGKAMGYPETAVEAYAHTYSREKKKDLLLLREEEKEVLTKEEQKFLFFRLSRANYKKEIEWVEQVMAALKKHMPELYEKISKR